MVTGLAKRVARATSAVSCLALCVGGCGAVDVPDDSPTIRFADARLIQVQDSVRLRSDILFARPPTLWLRFSTDVVGLSSSFRVLSRRLGGPFPVRELRTAWSSLPLEQMSEASFLVFSVRAESAGGETTSRAMCFLVAAPKSPMRLCDQKSIGTVSDAVREFGISFN